MVDVTLWFTFLLFATFIFGVIAVRKHSVAYCIWTELAMVFLTPYVGNPWLKSALMIMVLVYSYIGYKIVAKREDNEKAARLAQIRPKEVEYEREFYEREIVHLQ